MSDQTKTSAKAVLTVHKYEPKEYDKPAEGPVLSQIHVEESYSGDIEGKGTVELLQAARGDGSASFVGIKRVTGKIGGKEGTFLLQDIGTIEGKSVSGEWFVVPGSGTGNLAGLRGEGGIRANLGENAQVYLDYWFE
jgi:hypothetical protein